MWCFWVGKCVGKTPLLILRSVGVLLSVVSTKVDDCSVALPFPLTVSGLAKVAIFTTNVDAENQTLINHTCVCGVLNRHFCQTRVGSSFSFSRHGFLNLSIRLFPLIPIPAKFGFNSRLSRSKILSQKFSFSPKLSLRSFFKLLFILSSLALYSGV